MATIGVVGEAVGSRVGEGLGGGVEGVIGALKTCLMYTCPFSLDGFCVSQVGKKKQLIGSPSTGH